MSKFLKLKEANGKRLLVNAAAITSVHELGEGSRIETEQSEYTVKESYQTVVKRLTKGDKVEVEVETDPAEA